jgi:hypothetical protein
VAGLVALTVAEQIEQHDVLPASGQGPGRASVQVTVEEQPVQEHEDMVTLAVRLVREAPTLEDELPARPAGAVPRTGSSRRVFAIDVDTP